MFYQKVLQYCNENNMSIHKFEQMCGLGNGVIDNWDPKKVHPDKPKVETLKKISQATGIPIEKWIND